MRKPSQQKSANRNTTTQHAGEAPLLADGAEEEVRVRIGQIAQLLLPLPEPGAEEPARSDPDERLIDLEARLGGRVAGIEEGQHPGKAILGVADLVEHQDHRQPAQQDEVTDAWPPT